MSDQAIRSVLARAISDNDLIKLVEQLGYLADPVDDPDDLMQLCARYASPEIFQIALHHTLTHTKVDLATGFPTTWGYVGAQRDAKKIQALSEAGIHDWTGRGLHAAIRANNLNGLIAILDGVTSADPAKAMPMIFVASSLADDLSRTEASDILAHFASRAVVSRGRLEYVSAEQLQAVESSGMSWSDYVVHRRSRDHDDAMQASVHRASPAAVSCSGETQRDAETGSRPFAHESHVAQPSPVL